MVLLGSYVENLRLRRWMEACLHGLRNFQYPRAGIRELSCTILTVDVLWDVCRTRVALGAEVSGLGWVKCWRWGIPKKRPETQWVWGGHFLTWGFGPCPEFIAILLIERIMSEQHLGSSCEGTCRDLSSASRTYFYCKMRRLDVVYELVLVMLQSTRNGVV